VPILIVANGKTNAKNLKLIQTDNNEIENFLKNNDTCIKKTEVMTIDGNGRVYLKAKNKKFKILSFNLTQGVKW
jgi:uncharacterized membrane protein YcaP (DUF421 family)